MKIVYIHPNSLNIATANMRQVLQVCDALSNVGLHVELLVPKTLESLFNARKDEIIRDYQINFQISTFHDSKFNRLLGIFGIPQIQLKDRLKECDIVFCRDPSIVQRVKNFGIPILYEAHNALFHQKGGLRDLRYVRIMRKCFRNPQNHMLTISSALKQYYIKKGFDEQSITVEHDCHDGTHYENHLISSDLPILIKNIRSKFNCLAVYTGSLNENRGLEILQNLIKKQNQSFFLIAGGSREEINYWNECFWGQKNFLILKRLNKHEVKYIQQSADILLGIWSSKIPTIDYCSPLKLFEYLSWGKPIVLPDFPTFYEILDESNAWFYKKDDDASLEEAYQKANMARTDFKITSENLLAIASYYTWNERANRINGIMEEMSKNSVN